MFTTEAETSPHSGAGWNVTACAGCSGTSGRSDATNSNIFGFSYSVASGLESFTSVFLRATGTAGAPYSVSWDEGATWETGTIEPGGVTSVDLVEPAGSHTVWVKGGSGLGVLTVDYLRRVQDTPAPTTTTSTSTTLAPTTTTTSTPVEGFASEDTLQDVSRKLEYGAGLVVFLLSALLVVTISGRFRE